MTEIEDQNCLNSKLTQINPVSASNHTNLTTAVHFGQAKQLNQTNETATKKSSTNSSPLTTVTSLDKAGDHRTKLNRSLDSSPNSLCKLTKINSRSIDFHGSSPTSKKHPIKAETNGRSSIDQMVKEDLNNNDKECRNEVHTLSTTTVTTEDDDKPKVEMKTFRPKLIKTSSYDSNCSNSPDRKHQQVSIQENLVSKSDSAKKMLNLNRNSTKHLQRSCSEKSNDNTAKQVRFF